MNSEVANTLTVDTTADGENKKLQNSIHYFFYLCIAQFKYLLFASCFDLFMCAMKSRSPIPKLVSLLHWYLVSSLENSCRSRIF